MHGPTMVGYLTKLGVAHDPGTPDHPRGRGLVERLVKKCKDGLQRLLPQGKLLEWPKVLGELERRVNCMPHAGLAGVSPFDNLVLGHRQRSDCLAPLTGSLGTLQAEEDLALTLQALRQVADWCGEMCALKRTVESESVLKELPCEVGDWVLRLVSHRAHSLEPYFQGQYQVTADNAGGFYEGREVLAGDQLGVRVDCHVSRLIKFDGSRTSSDAEHERKLDSKHLLVEEIMEGPRAEDMHFLVKWRGVPTPTWEPSVTGLRAVVKFKEYCASKRLNLKGEPLADKGVRVQRLAKRVVAESVA